MMHALHGIVCANYNSNHTNTHANAFPTQRTQLQPYLVTCCVLAQALCSTHRAASLRSRGRADIRSRGRRVGDLPQRGV